jgi:hypothetical protein
MRRALSEGMRASLATLKDVGGITGSFVCTPNGRLAAREIPALFEDDVLAEAGSRLVRMREAFAAGGDALEVGVAPLSRPSPLSQGGRRKLALRPGRGSRQHAGAADGGEPGGASDRRGGRAPGDGAAARGADSHADGADPTTRVPGAAPPGMRRSPRPRRVD